MPTGALPRSLVENAAITLGRIAWVCPEPLAPHAPEFLGLWCAPPAFLLMGLLFQLADWLWKVAATVLWLGLCFSIVRDCGLHACG